MVWPPWPTTGRSKGMPIRVDRRPVTTRSVPSRSSNAQPSATSTVSRGRATSHGSGRRSQLSGCSRCQPSWMAWRKMPYS